MSTLIISWLCLNNLVLSYCVVTHMFVACSVYYTASKIQTAK